MKIKIVVAVAVIGFLAWLSQLLTPVHPRNPLGWIDPCVFGRTMNPNCVQVARTWDGHVRVTRRSDPVAALHW